MSRCRNDAGVIRLLPRRVTYHSKCAAAQIARGCHVTELTTSDVESSEAARLDTASSDPGQPQPVLQWAPAEPAPPRKRWGLRIGLPIGVVAVGAVAASLVLIAPGTAVAGVPVGLMTEGGAREAISQRLSAMTVQLGDGGPTVTGADLGASVDAGALAGHAFQEHPMWNVTQWFAEGTDAEVALDSAAATAALQDAAPDLHTAPTAASVAFDGQSYVATPAVDGEGIDVDAIALAVQEAFTAGRTEVVIDPEIVAVAHPASTEKAESAAARLNGILDEIGFYVGDERTVPVGRKTAASWITVDVDADGEFAFTADTAGIQAALDDLADDIDQKVVDATVVTNSEGDVLRTIVEGQDGRVLGDTTGLADDFAAQLATGDAVFALPVEVTPHKTTELARLLEVDISRQRLYLKENGEVVDTWLISSGRHGAETYHGHYSIGWKTSLQTMRGVSRDTGTPYEQPDVPWVMYFNGNQAFHGAYWHNNFGHRMSAGCVNMPPAKAKRIYDWSPVGVDVWIHG